MKHHQTSVLCYCVTSKQTKRLQFDHLSKYSHCILSLRHGNLRFICKSFWIKNNHTTTTKHQQQPILVHQHDQNLVAIVMVNDVCMLNFVLLVFAAVTHVSCFVFFVSHFVFRFSSFELIDDCSTTAIVLWIIQQSWQISSRILQQHPSERSWIIINT